MRSHPSENRLGIVARVTSQTAKQSEFFHLAAQLSRCATAHALHGAKVEPGAGIHEMPFGIAEQDAVDGEWGFRDAN
jgi:hypothetical protein